MTALSQQNIVDCDTVDKGCSGGWPKTTFGEYQSEVNVECDAQKQK